MSDITQGRKDLLARILEGDGRVGTSEKAFVSSLLRPKAAISTAAPALRRRTPFFRNSSMDGKPGTTNYLVRGRDSASASSSILISVSRSYVYA
jgi:hypothetical protein